MGQPIPGLALWKEHKMPRSNAKPTATVETVAADGWKTLKAGHGENAEVKVVGRYFHVRILIGDSVTWRAKNSKPDQKDNESYSHANAMPTGLQDPSDGTFLGFRWHLYPTDRTEVSESKSAKLEAENARLKAELEEARRAAKGGK